MRIALGQFNATVGDLAGNVAKMKKIWAEAMAAGADLVAFPEMAICGYPPEDLVYKKQFVQDNWAALEDLAAACNKKTVVVGFVEGDESGLYNAAAVIQKAGSYTPITSATCPTTACSTSSGTSRPATGLSWSTSTACGSQ